MPQAYEKPNFFIIGTGNSGTTALAEYLGEHPDVFFSPKKEPKYFNTDPHIARRKIFEKEEYLKLFEGSKGYTAVGEGSCAYIYSKEAVPNILAFNPEAKFIVMLRNPVDRLPSAFHQLRYGGTETETDIEKAWRLQEERAQGKNIPQGSRSPKKLQYGELLKIGDHLERLFHQVSRDKVLIIFFEDFQRNTQKVYEETLAFLGVNFDGRDSFPKVNPRKERRSWFLSRLINAFPGKVVRFIKKALGIKGRLNISTRLRQMNERTISSQKLSPAFRKELTDYFCDDIKKIEHSTGRDLSHWLQ